VYGQFLYSQPNNDVTYQQFNTGNFVTLAPLLFYTGQQFVLSAQSRLPHTSGSFGVELRPFRRLRIVESWLTDRLHNAGASQPGQSARLVSNYSQEQVDLFFDVSKKLTLRGGYRYVWGDGSTLVLHNLNVYSKIGGVWTSLDEAGQTEAQLLAISSLLDEAWQILHHLNSIHNPMAVGANLPVYLFASVRSAVSQSAVVARIHGAKSYGDLGKIGKLGLGFIFTIFGFLARSFASVLLLSYM
jgi:hypothetical protein